MNILITAGNTFVPIDRVRGMTNIFTGRTGTQIALQGQERGHAVTLLTSHPEAATEFLGGKHAPLDRWAVEPYQTFDDLHRLTEHFLQRGRFDALVHSAAVSDYAPAG